MSLSTSVRGSFVTAGSASLLRRCSRRAEGVGELGIGCNPGIDRYVRNIYFDEKIDGTVHIALGAGFDYVGGTNDSAIHWDIVKDLRSGGSIELDGKTVQENGSWATRTEVGG
jgi:leucyl aminopeptidase (aminopeptidase T)